MSRYVLRYRGDGVPPHRELARIEATVHVLDRAPRMLLVEGTGGGVRRLLAGLPGWVATKEATVPVPSTGPSLR